MIESSFHVFHNRLQVTLWIRTADDLLGHGILGDELGDILEVLGPRQLPRARTINRHLGPDPMRCSPCGLLVLGPADGQASVSRFALAAGFVEKFDEIALRTCGDEAISRSPGHFGATGTADGNQQGRRLLRQRVEPRVFDRVVPSVMTLVAAFPEQPDDAYGFLEPLLTHLGLRPRGTDDVFVEVLAWSDAEKEPSFHHRRRSGSGVGDNGRMHAHCRASYPRS